MSELKEVLSSYLYFGVIFAIFLVILAYLILFVSSKKKRKSYYLFGLLIGFDNKQILALTLIIINYLLLVYTLLFKVKLSLSFGLVSLFLILLSFVFLKKYLFVLVNGGINLVNIGLIYLANQINTLRLDNPDQLYYLLQIAINVFGILFYTFTSLKFFRNIQEKEYHSEKSA